jgi:hypothetical protein
LRGSETRSLGSPAPASRYLLAFALVVFVVGFIEAVELIERLIRNLVLLAHGINTLRAP